MAQEITQFELNLGPERKIWSVMELTARIGTVLAVEFAYLWVKGEVSNCRVAQSGHIYFTLKDERAQGQCVGVRNEAMRLRCRPEDGFTVIGRRSTRRHDPRAS